MTKIKKLSDSQIIGTKGEAFVTNVLSQFCLVRPVANGTDVGVDLYCESFMPSGIPHVHFWVQVKTVAKVASSSIRLRLKDLDYWLRQPIPVFIFHIGLSNCQSIDNFKIEVISLASKINIRSLPTDDPKVRHGSDVVMLSLSDVRYFLYHTVPDATSTWLIREGILRAVKRTANETYLKEYNCAPLIDFRRNILKTIGRNSALLLTEIVNTPALLQGAYELEREQLELILTSFAGWGNNDFHYALGLSKEKRGQFAMAAECYNRALRNIMEDVNLPSIFRQTSIEYMTAAIARCVRNLG